MTAELIRIATARPLATKCTFRLLLALFFSVPLFLGGCTTSLPIAPDLPANQVQLFQVAESPSADTIFSPAFLIKKPYLPYNRIGMPAVRQTARLESEIYVAPEPATLFFDTQNFSTDKGSYRNLIYRVHFEKVPFDLDNINITAGNNPGLLLIYTLNETGQLLLVTTVHTCGCYLAFFPTSLLNRESFPKGWPNRYQQVYGYKLPTLLALQGQEKATGPLQLVFTLESGTHRVSDVFPAPPASLANTYESTEMNLLSMDNLYRLPFKGGTESFFELDGPRKGYVRDNTKILERLLISWWAFDLHVGEDKAFGGPDRSGIPLYTSLKFWNRQSSDLKNFPRFLAHWGWKL